MAAKIIYLDGPKGAGKSTVLRSLWEMVNPESEDLKDIRADMFKDKKIIFDRQPASLTAMIHFGIDDLLTNPFAAVMYFSADRAVQAARWVAQGWVETADLIIVDRSPISTLVHQGRYFEPKWLDNIIEQSISDLRWTVESQHYLIFKLPFEVADQRVFARDGARSNTQIGEHYMAVDFYNNIHTNQRARDLGELRFIEAEKDQDSVLGHVLYHIQDILELI